MAEVALDAVSREYPGGSRAVDNVSFTVRDRELLVLVGPSGCGKSTTLRMIAGLEPLSAGEIRIAGRRVDGVSPRDRDIAMVFQGYALYPHMTVRANMAFALELKYGGGWVRRGLRKILQSQQTEELKEGRRAIVTRVQEVARVLGIEHLLDRLPRQLSGGERQRVALGRAIVRRPAAFLFDEPLSNLDARLRVEMRRELKELHQKLGATMIYVTHDQVEALTLGDRIAVMQKGVLQQIGTPAEVYESPRNTFVAGFLGSPPMNLLAGVWSEDADGLGLSGQAWRYPVSPEIQARLIRPVQVGEVGWLGVRPESLKIQQAKQVAESGLSQVGWAGEVTLVEALGDVVLVSVRLIAGSAAAKTAEAENLEAENPEPETVVVKMPARQEVKVGDGVIVTGSEDRWHLFEEQGESLLRSS